MAVQIALPADAPGRESIAGFLERAELEEVQRGNRVGDKRDVPATRDEAAREVVDADLIG